MQIIYLDPATAPNYAREILTVYRDVSITTYSDIEPGVTSEDVTADYTDLEARIEYWRNNILSDKNRGFWIAQTGDDRLIGFSGALKGEAENELEFAFVLPEYQGKGIGRALITSALDWLGSDKMVKLNLAESNLRAQQMYEQLGFTLTDEKYKRQLKIGKQLSWATMKRAPV